MRSRGRLRTDVNDANSLDESRWTKIRIGAVRNFSWNWRYGDIGVLSHLVKQAIDLTSPGAHRWGSRWKVIRVVENDKPLRRITFTPEPRVDSTQSCLNRWIQVCGRISNGWPTPDSHRPPTSHRSRSHRILHRGNVFVTWRALEGQVQRECNLDRLNVCRRLPIVIRLSIDGPFMQLENFSRIVFVRLEVAITAVGVRGQPRYEFGPSDRSTVRRRIAQKCRTLVQHGRREDARSVPHAIPAH